MTMHRTLTLVFIFMYGVLMGQTKITNPTLSTENEFDQETLKKNDKSFSGKAPEPSDDLQSVQFKATVNNIKNLEGQFNQLQLQGVETTKGSYGKDYIELDEPCTTKESYDKDQPQLTKPYTTKGSYDKCFLSGKLQELSEKKNIPRFSRSKILEESQLYEDKLRAFSKSGSSADAAEVRSAFSRLYELISEAEKSRLLHVEIKAEKGPVPSGVRINYILSGDYDFKTHSFKEKDCRVFMDPPNERMPIYDWVIWISKGRKIISDPKKVTAKQMVLTEETCNVEIYIHNGE